VVDRREFFVPHARWIIALTLMCMQVVGGATGFAAAALSIPVILIVEPDLEAVLPMICVIGLVLSIGIATLHAHDIDFRKAAMLIPPTLLGLPLGMLALDALPEQVIKISLGLFVMAVAVRGLLRRGELRPWTGWPRWAALLLPFAGGIIHGAFNSGGPLVVAYAERTLRRKASFRATLSIVFIPMNVWLLAWHIAEKRYTREVIELTTAVFPFAALGWVVGMMLHGHLSERLFRRIVLVLLLILGCLTTVRAAL
jgi:uncharacterized membrane protein YfcA